MQIITTFIVIQITVTPVTIVCKGKLIATPKHFTLTKQPLIKYNK